MNLIKAGESINDAGREFKAWFTDFTLVYSPTFIVVGLMLTGVDLFLNLGIGNSLWFKIPWSIAQLFAVDGLWFAVWNRILTDEYKWKLWAYHGFLIFLGLAMTSIAVVMNYIIFTQDYMGLKDSVAAMNFLGIPVGLFLLTRSILLMLTATLAIVLDKVMRAKKQGYHGLNRKASPKPERSSLPEPATTVIPEDEPATKPARLALPEPEPAKPGGYRESIKAAIQEYRTAGQSYTYKDIAEKTGASIQTVKVHAPKVKRELGIDS
jgi:hypothetical protein